MKPAHRFKPDDLEVRFLADVFVKQLAVQLAGVNTWLDNQDPNLLPSKVDIDGLALECARALYRIDPEDAKSAYLSDLFKPGGIATPSDYQRQVKERADLYLVKRRDELEADRDAMLIQLHEKDRDVRQLLDTVKALNKQRKKEKEQLLELEAELNKPLHLIALGRVIGLFRKDKP